MRKIVASNETNESAAPAPLELSAAVRRSLERVRAPFKAFSEGFTMLAGKREQLAPKFMAGFETYKGAAGPDATFIDYVRFLDPEVPADRNGYKAHKAYQAADYLRRLDASLRSAKEAQQRDPRSAPVKPLDAMARILGSVLPLLPEAERAKVWEALRSEFHWQERIVAKMQKTVEDVLPLLQPSFPRGVSMPAMKVRIVHAEVPVQEQPVEEPIAMAANG